MVFINGASFMMGEDQRNARYMNEMPEHVVHLNDFFIDKYEVTQAQYKVFVDAEHYAPPSNWVNGRFPESQANMPVVDVTWNDAATYCRFVNKRLPTEAEWEYAAAGPSDNTFPWGNRFERSFANTAEDGQGRAVSVFARPKDESEFGVVGLAGNVSEWTADWYRAYPMNDSPESQYGETYKVVRGGSFRSKSIFARTAFRGFRKPDLPADDIGLRCARSGAARRTR